MDAIAAIKAQQEQAEQLREALNDIAPKEEQNLVDEFFDEAMGLMAQGGKAKNMMAMFEKMAADG
jgi:hypothetical protein